ncbi:MAG: hypothetical protein H6838_18435 [Planctomycetes bacterium]|nr:hypothetical protein [Planctomycetota bacterium]MCB9887476.1 hypothetical protein [Planctomycetota bacterium]
MHNPSRALPFLLLTAACAGTSSSLDMSPRTFALSREQADQVIRETLAEGWPENQQHPLGGARIGYSIQIWWLLDHDDVSAEALEQADGTFVFGVRNHGTAPVAGNPARRQLLERLVAKATALAGAQTAGR